MNHKHLLNHEVFQDHSHDKWVVMIHGAGGSIKTWKYQIPFLKEHYNLVLLDLRDHGLSKFNDPSPSTQYSFELISLDIKQVLDHLGIEKAHFISLSLGSVLIQHFMMRYPKLVDKAIFAGGIFKADLKLKLAAEAAKIVNYVLPYRLMYRWFSYLIMPKERNQLARLIFMQQAKKLTPKEYNRWVGMKASFFHILEEAYRHPFEHQCLVVMGDEDYAFFENAKEYVRVQKNTQFIEIHKTGHICNIEKHNTFNHIVLDFFGSKKTPAEKSTSRVMSYTN